LRRRGLRARGPAAARPAGRLPGRARRGARGAGAHRAAGDLPRARAGRPVRRPAGARPPRALTAPTLSVHDVELLLARTEARLAPGREQATVVRTHGVDPAERPAQVHAGLVLPAQPQDHLAPVRAHVGLAREVPAPGLAPALKVLLGED